MRPDFPFRPAALPFYYGWVVLGVSTLGIVMSVPGQTMGVSVFTDPLLEATGLGRVALSNAYLVGTVASGLCLPWAGRLVDRFGVRGGVVFACLGLGLVLVFMSRVDRVAVWLAAGAGVSTTAAAGAVVTLGFAGIRFTGQGMLTLVSRTMLGRWFERRRGLVSSLTGPIVSFTFAGAPLVLALWLERAGWRGAWLEMALVVAVGMGGLGWLLYRDSPEACGLVLDGGAPAEPGAAAAPARPERAFTRAQALRTPVFWLVTLGVAGHSMVGTGLTFHIVDLGAEAGLGRAAAVAIFLPISLVSVPTGIAVGAAIDRFAIRHVVMVMMAGQAVMFALAGHLGDPLLRAGAIAGWGLSGGFFGPLTVAALPGLFGRAHLGAIQGVMMMVLVIASALGPSALALMKAAFGAYAPGLHALAVLPVVVLLAAPFVKEPDAAA